MTRWLAAILLLIATPACAAPTLQAHIKGPHKITTLTLEYATTEEARETGLMNRDTIGPADGMLFVFPAPAAPHPFWMRNTRIPLDVLFIDTSHHIIAIATGEPLSEKPIGPAQPVASVIELDAGRARKDGIGVGDKVIYALPANTHVE